jgi:hypothetical protein
MPYLNNHVYSEQDLGLSFDDIASKGLSTLKTASDLYQLKKQQAQQLELAKIQAAAPQTALTSGAGGGFLQKHGLKLAIGAAGLLVLVIVLKKRK